MEVVPGNDTGQLPTTERHPEVSADGSSPLMTAGGELPTQQPQLPDDLHGPPPSEDVDEEDGVEEASNSSASDVETFNGKIVYNPDGSAYIIEGVDSELSDDEYSGLDLPLQAKCNSSTPTTATDPRSTPHVVNALHIARHPAFYSALYGQAYNFLRENRKVPEIPVMHSYRVFTVKDSGNSGSGDKVEESADSLTSAENRGSTDSSYPLWDCGTVPVKPILMCFICKLSFGYTKSFVAHATGEHSLSLNEAERELVTRKNTSAVIQGVSTEPLLSFLEPIPTSTTSSAQVSSSGGAGSDGFLTAHTSSSVTSSSLIVHPATTASQHDCSISSTASSSSFSAAITTVVSASSCPVTSVPEITAPRKEDAVTPPTLLPSSNFGDVLMAPELEDLANIEKMAEAAAAAAAAAVTDAISKSSPSPPSTNGPLDGTTASMNHLQEMKVANGSSAGAGTLIDRQQSPIASSSERPVSRDSTGSISPKGLLPPHINTCHSPSPMATAIISSSPLGLCAHHPDGKTNGVECPKCDMILGSSRSLGGHMTMMHSRNSCKTLKCPKCNWHYKYQETLEIHMKEKHPENEMTCLYCVTNQPHPRLARGETYTCGYKPYRCEVCNYSTTTKGNLSIHMQSDKHINNVQELQNGNLTPEHMAALQQQSQQQQQQQQQQANPSSQSVSNSTVLAVPPTVSPASDILKKTPTAPKPKATWRCDVCNYETNVARNLRIHMTSEKHTHNMMVLQQNMKHMQHLSALQQAQAMDPVFPFHPGLLMPADAQLQPEAAIADMAYNHALLMMASQQQHNQQHHQQQQQQQQQRAMAVAAAAAAAAGKTHHIGTSPLNLSCGPSSMDVEHPDPALRPDIPYEDVYKLFQCCVCTLFSSNSLETLGQHVQLDRSRLREDEVLTAVAGTYICKLCTYKTNLKANFQLHCKTDKHLQRLHHVNHVKEGGPRNEWKLKYVNVSNPVQVRCNACDYYTNSLHKLQLHATSPRHDTNGRLFLHLERGESVISSDQKSYQCNLCSVSVSNKVHLIQHMNSLSHLRNENIRHLQGEGEPDMRDMFIVKQIRPNSENSRSVDDDRESKQNDVALVESLPLTKENVQKVGTQKSAESSVLKRALLDKGNAESGNITESSHACPFCNYTSNSEVRIQMHVVAQHSQKPATLACPLCQESFPEWAMLENHLMDVHHVTQEGVKRLMAMVDQTEWANASKDDNKKKKPSLRTEAATTTSIATTSVPPVTSVATVSAVTNATASVVTTNSAVSLGNVVEVVNVKEELADIDGKSDSSDSRERTSSDEGEDFMCHACGRSYCVVEDLFCHQNEVSHLELKTTTKGTGYFCWKKGCLQFFPTMTATQIHFKEIHAQKAVLPVSDRHVYKYRCNQCSLAFKTMEKLQLHLQYHIIRAATKCVLCGRSFRTVLALQKHVEISHADMTKEELEQYRASLANNPLLSGNGSTGGGVLDPQTTELLKKESNRDEIEEEDEGGILPEECDIMEDIPEDCSENKEQQVLEDYINSQAMAEDSYNDPNRKYKCHRCKVAFTRQSYLTSHNKTLLHRKGEKMSYPMEKYLDPNRPFKCEVCKESFTQKNILLVHYNSVSHLHKLKLSMKENGNCTSSTTTASVTTATTAITTTAPQGALNCITTAASNNNCASSTDGEKKPYKCNICKVSYSQASTLDIHVRSVLHQTRASKLHELAITGQIDLTNPLVERPEPSNEQQQSHQLQVPKTTDSGSLSTSSSQTSTIHSTSQPSRLPDVPSLPLTTSSSSPATAPVPVTSSQFPFPMPSDSSILQSSLGLVPPLAPPSVLGQSQNSPQSMTSCQRCGAVCMSQESLIQHQNLYCFFSQHPSGSLLSAVPTTSQPPVIPGMGQSSHLSMRSQIGSQQERDDPTEKQAKNSQLHPETSASPATSQISHPTPQRSPTPGQQMFRSRFSFLRPKPLFFRHLLEGFGFDLVMQFNESSQKRSRKENDKKDSQDTKELMSAVGDPNDDQTLLKKSIDLPEINRSVCSRCGKDFSSIWVLKAHQEEMHKDIVPIKVVEKFADDFRTDYERRNASSMNNPEDLPNISEANSPSSNGELSTGPSSTPATPSGQTPLSLPSAATPPATSMGSQMADMSSSLTASHMAAQLQFNQLLMSMGLGMGLPMPMNMGMNMNLPFAAATMNMHPPLIPLIMPPPLDPLMASAFSHPMMSGSPMDPNFFAAQQKLLQQQQQQLCQAQQQKRARTRISDDQLKILRAYFDINNSPTEEQLIEMSDKSGLPLKVIKHWFRNTLFKERQRNKDSPYNFSNPPSTFLNLEEYEKTGETKITSMNEKHNAKDNNLINHSISQIDENLKKDGSKSDDVHEMNLKVKIEADVKEDCQKLSSFQNKQYDNRESFSSCMTSLASEMYSVSEALASCNALTTPTSSALGSIDLRTSLSESFSCNLAPFVTTPSMMSMPPTSSSPPTSESPHSTGTPSGTPTPSSCSASGKRANRTRFTDYQIKVLQEFFETNAYPKDDDLEYLSKLLNLSPRVIVVWFQNARQKARKVYENQPPITTEEENAGRFQRTPGLNYQCKKCLQVFQRYYELIKHQKSSCFKDENPLASQIKILSNEERSQPPTPTLPSNSQVVPRTPEKFGNQNGTYRCDKCSLAFPRFDLWREHQLVHMMNPTLFPNYTNSTFPMLSYDNQVQLSQMKRKLSDDEESNADQPRDKRLRTTILPEQLDFLYQQYQVESNPSRKMLENIAKEVGLKKRVVQVWFQNTRARERKGQFRAHQQVIHKRCPFCRALFKARSALESHLATRHADQYTKGDINIDALPDGDIDSNPETPSSPSEEKIPTSVASPCPSVSCPSTSSETVNTTMKRYYEDSLKKYLDELCGIQEIKETPTDLSVKPDKSEGHRETGETPLDLSKPLKAMMEKSNGSFIDRFIEDNASRGAIDDARSETYSESTDNMDGDDMSFESNPTSPSSHHLTNSSKRFRTQMTTVQLKVMKTIFVDYKTPSMSECETLGREIGLPKRVVQVWFQNARAKEKKAKLAFMKTFGHEVEPNKPSEECTLCNVKYNLKFSASSLQEHLFSKKHIENLKNHIDSMKKLTEGQESDTTVGQDVLTNHSAVTSSGSSVASSPTTTNTPTSSQQQTSALMQMMGLPGLSGGLPNFPLPTPVVTSLADKVKSEPPSSNAQRKDTSNLNNGEIAPTLSKPKEESDLPQNPMPQLSAGQENPLIGDFMMPATDSASLFPYMYAGFPGYYGGVPGAFLHHSMYPGRTKL